MSYGSKLPYNNRGSLLKGNVVVTEIISQINQRCIENLLHR